MNGSTDRPHIVVVGLMGAGKTSVADGLARTLGVAHRDSDRDIELLLGNSGRDVAATQGVDALHSLEEAVLLGALAQQQRLVISAAGWVVESPLCCAALARRAQVVWLDVDTDLVEHRMATGTHRRSMDHAELAALAQRRRPMFASVADLTLRAGDRSVAELVDEAVRLLG
jgi:shikimate kinase